MFLIFHEPTSLFFITMLYVDPTPVKRENFFQDSFAVCTPEENWLNCWDFSTPGG